MKKFISLMLAISLMCGFTFAESSVSVTTTEEAKTSAFDAETLTLFKQMIQDLYYKEVTDEELYEAALKGMFQSLDPYSNYYNKEETTEFSTGVSGSYSGIGIKFEGYTDYMRIVKVFVNTPAYNAGILAGDYIIEVNGESIEGWSSTKVASVIRGDAGSKVDLKILRGKEILKFSVERANVQAESCEFKVYGTDADIGYIKIEEFNASTSTEMSNYLHTMKVLGINKLILDLRDNPGGYVDQAVLTARNFVPEGVITTLKYKDENKENIYKSYLKEPYFKVVALVNGNSASSSEILAGALKDSGASVLIGTTTYGKGVFQNVYNLKNGGSVKITTGSYYTPSGICIDGIGIEPNIVVEGAEEQLNRAIEEVQKL